MKIFNGCMFGHDYVVKGSWSRCSQCWRKPPTERRLAPKRRRNVEGWKKGPIR